MSKEKRRVPKLRFPGFTEDWEQRKLSEIVTINPKTELPDEFKYVDLESVVGTNLLGFQVIKKENAPSRAQRLASYGDVFYQTVRPYQRNNYLFENVDKDMVFSTGYAQLRSKLDSYFLLTLVQNNNFVKVVLDNCTGTSYPAINRSELGKIIVQIPSNEVEANQIGKVFRGIDKSITLHQRKLEQLNLKKKALLQKLFPKNGECYPELRFPGFTDAWEQRKFGELFEYERPDAYIVKSDNYNNDFNMPVLTANKAFILGYTNEENSYNKPSIIFDDFTLDRKYVDFPYMLKSSAIKILTSKNQHNLRFLFERLNSTRFEVLGHARHYISVVQNTTTLCPSVDEEVCISNLLTKFDEIITLHQRKLDHLQLQKKALLQQMFV